MKSTGSVGYTKELESGSTSLCDDLVAIEDSCGGLKNWWNRRHSGSGNSKMLLFEVALCGSSTSILLLPLAATICVPLHFHSFALFPGVAAHPATGHYRKGNHSKPSTLADRTWSWTQMNRALMHVCCYPYTKLRYEIVAVCWKVYLPTR
jgi:hypothetical protein